MSNQRLSQTKKNSIDIPSRVIHFDSIAKGILFEDNHLIIFNKRPSDLAQGDKTGDKPLGEHLKEYLKIKYHKPGDVFLGVVHRLDRPVSGAILFARTSKSLTRLNAMLKNGEIHKTYWAVVKNHPPSETGRLSGYLTRNEQQNKSYISAGPVASGQLAELDYRVVDRGDRYWLLEIDLLTGRHHQIRAQLAAIGCPIKGDLKYGYPRSNPGGFIHLHARIIAFVHPVRKEPVRVVAPLPEDPLWNYFNRP